MLSDYKKLKIPTINSLKCQRLKLWTSFCFISAITLGILCSLQWNIFGENPDVAWIFGEEIARTPYLINVSMQFQKKKNIFILFTICSYVTTSIRAVSTTLRYHMSAKQYSHRFNYTVHEGQIEWIYITGKGRERGGKILVLFS